ncbi:MAG: hypothetical protein KKA28_06140 [Planctomycetes bacterium]|nr:hypothetical protein [Planctomycetota bacterium]MCG2685148.1 hypothetical protein [Planctomycetales bacterium]
MNVVLRMYIDYHKCSIETSKNVFLKLKYPYLAPGEYTRGRRFFTVNPARRAFTAG